MQDHCSPADCPVNARVDGLEREFNRYRSNSTDTHKQMFDRLGALEQGRATLETKLDGIDEKLDELAASVGVLAGKSGKRWDGLMDKLIYLAAGAVVAWVAAGAPGLG